MSSLILLEVPKKGQIPDLTCQPRTISDETPATRFAMADTVEQYMQELLWEAMAMSHLWGVVLDYAWTKPYYIGFIKTWASSNKLWGVDHEPWR